MTDKIIKFACPYCYKEFNAADSQDEFDSLEALQSHLESAHAPRPSSPPVWGREIYPPPRNVAFIETNDMKCVGCGLCAEACSMQHYGVINKSFSRIYIRKFLLPIPKAVAVTCCQCQKEERPCEKACPVTPPAIYFDEKTLHMVINQEACTGCLSCRKACDSEAIHYNPDLSAFPFVCDLCDTLNNGDRDPQCVKICPVTALYYHNREERVRPVRDTLRRSSEEKAELIARRLYPLTRSSIAFPPWNP
jgi:Fe-S-cluster-containing hydrogenase component 2